MSLSSTVVFAFAKQMQAHFVDNHPQGRKKMLHRKKFSQQTIEIQMFFGIACTTLLVGCSDGTATSNDTPMYIRDIQPIVQDRCKNCHTDRGIAPFALETYEQVHAVKDAVKAAVRARTMPPWSAAPDCTDYRGDPSLTDAQIDLIERWADAGGPLGNANDTPTPVTHESLNLSRVDLALPIPSIYTTKEFPDDYRCFFLDWPESETTYVTGFGVEPGNASIVHHAIAYVVPPANIGTFQALEDADPEPGWTCFGGPGGEASGPGQASWLGGWAPGGVGEDFPEGTGIAVPVGAKIIVQIHYNGMKAEQDQTKVLVRTEKSVQKQAAILPFANIQWVLGGAMNIPAHTNDVVHSFTQDPSKLVKLITAGALSGDKPLTIYSVGLHMHTLGTSIGTRLERADGSSECLIDVPRWDFHWQRNYSFKNARNLVPGDKLSLECHWDNPGSAEVNWGENTSDEMCLAPYYLTE